MNKNSKGFSRIFVLITLVLFIIVGIGYWTYKNGQIKSAFKQIPLYADKTAREQREFLKSIRCVYTFKDSKGNTKKVVCSWGELEADVYLTDEFFNKDTAVKLAHSGQSEVRAYFHWPKDNIKRLIAVGLIGPGDSQELILADENGQIISSSVIRDNASNIGLGTVIKGMYHISFEGFRSNTERVFVLKITDAYGEEYLARINGLTGEYIEGSRQKIK